MEITQELVKSLFDYHEEGYLIWKVRLAKCIHIGDKAGYLNKTGEINRNIVRIKGKYYIVARIIFLWHKGWLPENVDHRDRDSINDRIENLRAATRSQNQMNRRSNIDSTSKYLGVSWNKRMKKWVVSIKVNKKGKYLGCFIDEEKAALAYNEAASMHFGEFANLNIIQNSLTLV
ncbi:MAG TPA: HNH endonuclease [Bacteroidia bacterium]|nr:HNH endonuclease [Bacteroidia bacterium]